MSTDLSACVFLLDFFFYPFLFFTFGFFDAQIFHCGTLYQ